MAKHLLFLFLLFSENHFIGTSTKLGIRLINTRYQIIETSNWEEDVDYFSHPRIVYRIECKRDLSYLHISSQQTLSQLLPANEGCAVSGARPSMIS